jgi:N-acetylglutamate synthase-like GNAT family acetyltransferase
MEEILHYCESNQLFGITDDSSGDIVGLCYAALDEKNDVWEVGGLIVAEELRKGGFGKLLLQMALAHTIAFQEPFKYGQRIISHVHVDNKKPRGLFEELHFEYSRQVKVPPEIAPASMARNEAGELIGDEFEFRRKALQELSRWLNEEFDGTLGPSVKIDVNVGDAAYIDILKQAVAHIADTA